MPKRLLQHPAIKSTHYKVRLPVDPTDADFTVVDRNGRFSITEEWLASRCGWSPFKDMELKRRVLGTIFRGHVAMWETELSDTAGVKRFASRPR